MSTNPESDPFQRLLASAHAVQESGIDPRLLTAVLEVQRSIVTGVCDADGAMRLVAEHARNAANAAGIAIAMLEGDRLIYRAGSGSAAARIGRQLTAILSVSALNPRREILRVENAENNSRIESEICRQFGASSLLILPIYCGQAMAGVLEVHFSEAHAFKDGEVRTYRLMAGLIGEALQREIQQEREKTSSNAARIPQESCQAEPQMEKVRGEDNAAEAFVERAPRRRPEQWRPGQWRRIGRAFAALGREVAGLGFAAKAERASGQRQEARGAYLQNLWWAVVAVTLVSALAIDGWIAYTHRTAQAVYSTRPMPGTGGQQSPVISEKPLLMVKPSPANQPADQPVDQPAEQAAEQRSNVGADAIGTTETTGALSGFKRVRVRPQEVDYVAEDVTMRTFLPKTEPQRKERSSGGREVNIGDDVTIRYFADKPSSARQTPQTLSPAPTVERPLPVAK
jgi:hypothetical protein